MVEEIVKVVAPLALGAGADASVEGASAVVVVEDSLAGEGGDEGSASGDEEDGLVELESESEESGEAAGDDDALDALGEEAGDGLDDFGEVVGADFGEEAFPVFGDAAGELAGAPAEANPTRATKIRARTIIWRAIFFEFFFLFGV